MSRTPRCAGYVESEMVSLVVVQQAGRYMATLTVLPIAGDHPPPIVIFGEGPTVARATGAAEAKAWKALRVADKCVEQLPRDRPRETRQQRLSLGEEG